MRVLNWGTCLLFISISQRDDSTDITTNVRVCISMHRNSMDFMRQSSDYFRILETFVKVNLTIASVTTVSNKHKSHTPLSHLASSSSLYSPFMHAWCWDEKKKRNRIPYYSCAWFCAAQNTHFSSLAKSHHLLILGERTFWNITISFRWTRLEWRWLRNERIPSQNHYSPKVNRVWRRAHVKMHHSTHTCVAYSVSDEPQRYNQPAMRKCMRIC